VYSLSFVLPGCLGEPWLSAYLDGMSENDQQGGNDTAPIPSSTADAKTPAKVLSPAAERALAEAVARREAAQQAQAADAPAELGGRKGPEPTRFGDWEKKGIICDF